MIKNEKQYKMTQKLLAEWEANYSLLLSNPVLNTPEWVYKAQLQTAKHEIHQLKDELKEYNDIRTGKHKLLDLALVDELPEWLIKWRIARNLTQKELAKLLGLHEQQIQRYENTNYSNASLTTVSQIAKVLQDYRTESSRDSA